MYIYQENLIGMILLRNNRHVGMHSAKEFVIIMLRSLTRIKNMQRLMIVFILGFSQIQQESGNWINFYQSSTPGWYANSGINTSVWLLEDGEEMTHPPLRTWLL